MTQLTISGTSYKRGDILRCKECSAIGTFNDLGVVWTPNTKRCECGHEDDPKTFWERFEKCIQLNENQKRTLTSLSSQPNGLSVGELATLEQDRNVATRFIQAYLSRLVRIGLVNREADRYTVSDAGLKALASAPWFERKK